RERPTRMESLKTASQTLVKELRNTGLSDRSALVSFNESARIDLNFSSNYNILEQKVNALYANGGTNLGSGLHLANQLFQTSPSERKKIVIALTDGQNTHYTTQNFRGQ